MPASAHVILAPGREKRVRGGHPWVFATEVAEVRGEYRPGDHVDVLTHDGGRFTLLVGDVAGHGVRAALVASFLKALVGALFVDPPVVEDLIRLDTVLERLNERICGSLPGSLGMMITLGACTIDTVRGTLAVSSAGHPAALLRRAGKTQALGARGIPLGTQAGSRYEMNSVPLADGDLLVLYTDGLIERKDVAIGEGEKRLVAAVEAETADEGLAARLASALEPVGGYEDDVAVLAASISLHGGR